jgi:decaprenyl-phosphate phosphoribosyltransferase
MRSTGRVEKPRIRSRSMSSSGAGPSLGGEVWREPLAAWTCVGSSDTTVEDGGTAGAVTDGPRRGRVRAAWVTIRPRQWIKNGLVVAAAGAAGALGHDDVPVRVALACAAFCMLASGIYAINDVHDAEEDRLHPRKRYRPVAAGELDPRTAVGLGFGLMASGLVLCTAVALPLAGIGAGYLALTLSYTLVWRHIVLLDVIAIAGGFVLRAVAGGLAAPVALSRWFMLVVTCAAVFVAAGKRQAELRRTEPDGAPRRSVLQFYTADRLRLIVAASTAGALFSYCVWAFELPDVDGIPWRMLTIVPFVACLLRYGAEVRRGGGEAPEELVLADRWLLLASGVWLVLFAMSVHAAG